MIQATINKKTHLHLREKWKVREKGYEMGLCRHGDSHFRTLRLLWSRAIHWHSTPTNILPGVFSFHFIWRRFVKIEHALRQKNFYWNIVSPQHHVVDQKLAHFQPTFSLHSLCVPAVYFFHYWLLTSNYTYISCFSRFMGLRVYCHSPQCCWSIHRVRVKSASWSIDW